MSSDRLPVRLYVVACSEAGTPGAGKSSGDVSGEKYGASAARPCDPLAYRRVFPERWGQFLRRNFHNPLHVAVFFSVDEKTARLWWNFVNSPQGWVVGHAIRSIPGAAAELLEAA